METIVVHMDAVIFEMFKKSISFNKLKKGGLMSSQSNSSCVITKKDKHGDITTIEIDGIEYDLIDDNQTSIPLSAFAGIKTSEFPQKMGVMLLNEEGGAFADTQGIHPTWVTLSDDKTAVVRCEINICSSGWDGVIGYAAYRNALLHLFEFPELVDIARREYLVQTSETLNYGFDFTIEGSTIGDILSIAKHRIDKILEPLSDIEGNIKRELEKLKY